jgi:hypothetical protein
VNTLTFIAPSGAPASGTIIEQLTIPGNTSGANFLGFFGTGGPQGTPFAVIIDRYQDKTFITNMSGTNLGVAPWGLRASGQLINHKYLTSNTTNINGGGSVALSTVPIASGTLLIRFVPSGAVSVVTQNAALRAVILNSTSGVDNVTSVVTGLKIQGFEPISDSAWTQMAGAGAIDNQLQFNDHNTSNTRHDFFACLSASPEAVGQRNNFGFFMIIEFL